MRFLTIGTKNKNMGKYNFQVFADNDFRSLEIDVDEHQLSSVNETKNKLLKLLEFMDIYDQLIQSHIECKGVFYTYSIQSQTEKSKSQILLQQVRSELNRRMFSTLNLGKLYLDKHHKKGTDESIVKKISEDPEKHLSVTELKEQIFQDNLEYMIGCELRNFSQHASIIARTIHQGTTRNLETGYLTTNLSASISKRELSKDVKRHKLDRMPEAIDLQSCLDGYVDGISQMHVLNLQLLKETIDSLILEIHEFANLARVEAELNTEYSYRVEIKPTFENDNPQGQSSILQLSISSTWLDLINILRDKQRFRTNFLHTKYEPCQSSLPL